MLQIWRRAGRRSGLSDSKCVLRSMCAAAHCARNSILLSFFSLFLVSQSAAAEFVLWKDGLAARRDAEPIGLNDLGLFKEARLAADRSIPVFRAAALKYANYLYLSELIGKPTALVATGRPTYCVDIMKQEEVRSLFGSVADIREKGFWPFGCAPVQPIVNQIESGQFDLVLRYFVLIPSEEWSEKFKAAAAGNPAEQSELISQNRQAALATVHGLPSNYFASYSNPNFISLMLRKISKIRQLIFEEIDREGRVRRQQSR